MEIMMNLLLILPGTEPSPPPPVFLGVFVVFGFIVVVTLLALVVASLIRGEESAIETDPDDEDE